MSIDQTLDTKPWYRYPWTWFLIAVPFLTIIACTVTIVLAVKSEDGLVSDDYYKDGLMINQSLDRDRKARELGLSSFVGLLPGDRSVVLQVNGDDINVALPLKLVFLHATRKEHDQTFEIGTLSRNGQARIDIEALIPGKWYVQLESESGQWRLKGQMRYPGETDIALRPSV